MIALRSIASRFTWIGLNTITGILAARALQPQGRGELAAMILWPTLVGGLTAFGLPKALIYHVRRDPKRASALAGSAALLCVLTTIIGTAIAWHVIPLWLRRQPEHTIFVAQLCLLVVPIHTLSMLGRSAWEASGHFGRSNLSQLIPPSLVIVGLGVQTWYGVLTPVSAAATYVLAGVPAFIWMLVSVARDYRPTLRGVTHMGRRLLHYGGRSYGADLAGILAHYLDQALVVGLLSSASMGIYVVALSLANVVAAVNQSVSMIVFPRAVGLTPREMATKVAQSARMGSMAGCAIGITVLTAGPFLLRVLYGSAFAAAAHILPILVFRIIIGGFGNMLRQGFLAAGRPGIVTGIQVAGIGLSVPLLLVLVPRFGLAGAAVTLLIVSIVRVSLTLACYRLILRVPMPRLWINRTDLAALARYRTEVLSSVLRLRTAGGVK